MPELPEVETFVRGLAPAVGRTIASAEVLDARLAVSAEDLVGTRIAGIRRRGKYIGIDLGGTKVLMGLLDKNFRVCREYKAEIDANQGERFFLKTLWEGIEVLFEEGRITSKNILAAGVGCPGIIRFPKGVVKLSNNIAFLKNYPLQAKLSKYLKAPVLLENDANAGLYGEYKLGAARKKHHAIGIFLGTGVGGALII
ncbi:MAG: ROK family protein, partial [bacterium]